MRPCTPGVLERSRPEVAATTCERLTTDFHHTVQKETVMARVSWAASVWIMFVVAVCTGAQDLPFTPCKKYIVEGEMLTCLCLGGCANGANPTRTWPSHSDTNRLEKTNITRDNNGQNFTCQKVCGIQTTEIIYTLRVAYGPDAASTNVTGPSPFITNGTLSMPLTCETSTNPSPKYSWSGVICGNGNSDNTCIYTPPIQDDGKRAKCEVTNPENSQAGLVSVAFNINLSYPPENAPNIIDKDAILKAGDKLTCTVTGGKPLVSSVKFYCDTPHHKDQDDDVINQTAVSSSVFVDTSQATEDNMTCYCSATWAAKPDFYTPIEERTFLTQYPAKVMTFALNGEHASLNVTESEQSNVTTHCDARGRPGPGLLLSRTSHDGTVNLTDTDHGNDSVTVNYLDHNITMANWTDMGNYTCLVWNGVGVKDSITLTLNVKSEPRPVTEEGRDRNIPLNMTDKSIQIDLRMYPEPDRFNYTHYKSDSDHTGDDVSPKNMFTSHVSNSAPGSNFMTCNIAGTSVPKEYTGVYKVGISNEIGSIDYYFAVKEEIVPKDGGGVVQLSTDATIIIAVVVAVVVLIILAVIIKVLVIRRKGRGRDPSYERHRTQTSSANEYTSQAFPQIGSDADNESGIGMNGRSSPPEMSNKTPDSNQAPRQSDGAGYASLNEFTPMKQQEGVLRKKSARTAAYEVTSITGGQVSIKQAAPQPNAYQEPWDIKKGDMTLADAPGGPPTPHNVGPKGDVYAMVSNAKNKTTITVGPQGAKPGKGDNTQGSPANAQGQEDAATSRGPPLSMTPHPLDTSGYATLAQMAPDQGKQGEVTNSSGDAAAIVSPVQNTSSPGDGTDTYDHVLRDGHDPKCTSQVPDVQYSHVGNY